MTAFISEGMIADKLPKTIFYKDSSACRRLSCRFSVFLGVGNGGNEGNEGLV
jgi:hypothetical protein